MDYSRDYSREVMIACKTLRTEIEHVVSVHRVTRRIVWMESQLHNIPANLTAALQKELDAIQDADRVLLAYGNCGNAVQGLKARDFELIVPCIDDCISMLFGSQKARELYSQENHAMFFTDGWMDEGHNLIEEYNRTVDMYDEETAIDMLQMLYAHYDTMAYLETGLYDVEALMARTRFIGEMCDMEQKRTPAVLTFVEQLVLGPWKEGLFVHVQPGEKIPSMAFTCPGSVL